MFILDFLNGFYLVDDIAVYHKIGIEIIGRIKNKVALIIISVVLRTASRNFYFTW